MKAGPPKANAQHSAASMEHGTPTVGVELFRHALGGLDLDPMSSAYWNHYSVKAARFYDVRTNGLAHVWTGRVFVNPPGADEKSGASSLVRDCWNKLAAGVECGEVEGAGWWGYTLEQLQVLQSCIPRRHPLLYLTIVLDARPRHLRRTEGGGAPVEGSSPTHGGYCTLLPSSRSPSLRAAQIARFVERGRALGAIVRPA